MKFRRNTDHRNKNWELFKQNQFCSKSINHISQGIFWSCRRPVRLYVPLKKGIELKIRIFLTLLTSHTYRERLGIPWWRYNVLKSVSFLLHWFTPWSRQMISICWRQSRVGRGKYWLKKTDGYFWKWLPLWLIDCHLTAQRAQIQSGKLPMVYYKFRELWLLKIKYSLISKVTVTGNMDPSMYFIVNNIYVPLISVFVPINNHNLNSFCFNYTQVAHYKWLV